MKNTDCVSLFIMPSICTKYGPGNGLPNTNLPGAVQNPNLSLQPPIYRNSIQSYEQCISLSIVL